MVTLIRPGARRSPAIGVEPLPREQPPEAFHGPRPPAAVASETTLSRVGVFAASELTPEPSDPFRGSGKYVAATSWTQALARYGRIPNIDLYAPHSRLESCRRQLHGLPGHRCGEPAAAAQLFPESELPARAAAHDYDALHQPQGLDLTAASCARARYGRGIFPVTSSQHAISYSFDLQRVFIPLLTAPIYPCDAIVCPTRSARQALENRLADLAERYSQAWNSPPPSLPRLEVIPWGVDAALFAPRDRATARRELNLPPDRPIVLCLGRMRLQDKMDWTPLLLAFQRVEPSVKEWPLLVLAGAIDPEYSERVMAHAAHLGLGNSIRTFFNLPAACLPSLYAACDVFVSPADSTFESFGLTVIEAMACGRPVVGSDWDGYKELIVHGETGFRARTDWAPCLGELDEAAPLLAWEAQHLHVGQSVSVDVGEMAHYLIRLLQNRELREAMGRRARARVEALYDWPIVIAHWEALWAELGAIARTIEHAEPDRLSYLEPNTFDHFSHYASRIIDDSTMARLTPRGCERLASRGAFLLHPWARGLLHPHALQAALAALRPAAWLRASLPVGKIVAALQKRHGLTRDRALMHLMWLAKYDLIALDGGENRPTP